MSTDTFPRTADVTGVDSGIGRAIGFLCSPRVAYVTGASYTVDGGLSLMAAHRHDHAGQEWHRL